MGVERGVERVVLKGAFGGFCREVGIWGLLGI